MRAAQSFSISIACDPGRVFDYIRDPRNLPQWATAFCTAVRLEHDGWKVDTPQGTVGLRFVEHNRFGVLDHYVSPAPGVDIYVPMRVLDNEGGSEVVFTLFRSPGTTDEQYAADAAMVRHDLERLKRLLQN